MTDRQRRAAHVFLALALLVGTLAAAAARLPAAATPARAQEDAAASEVELSPGGLVIAPAPPPAPPEPVFVPPPPWPLYADVTPLVVAAAARWGANPAVMRRIVWCESKNGTHRNTYRADLIHRGPFQFERLTWLEQAPRYLPAEWWGWSAALIPEANVELAAALIARGQTWRWPNC